MLRKIFICDFCLTPLRRINKAAILCEGENIIAIGGESSFDIEPGLEVVEKRNCYAMPGMIDTHIHGAGGFDSSSTLDEPADFRKMCSTLASHGITSFVPTITSGLRETMLKAVNSIVSLSSRENHYAKAVGIHLEGPFLSKEKHGAQNEEDIRPVDLVELKDLIKEGKGLIKIMTLAPELDNAVRLVEILVENNIVPSLGHSMANAAQTLKAIDAGAKRCTHIFNGMPPLHHREITLSAVALTDDRVDVEILIDGCHVHPRMIDLVCRSKPKNKIIAISDAVQATGLLDGEYHIGDTTIMVENGYVTTKNGILAGTTFTLERGLDQLISFTHLNNNEVAACLTINPAKSIGLSKCGELAPGRIADIAFFNKENNKTEMTVVNGNVVFNASQNKNE
jgi:N-acetylglucosamine-6-phosphate deacetylase